MLLHLIADLVLLMLVCVCEYGARTVLYCLILLVDMRKFHFLITSQVNFNFSSSALRSFYPCALAAITLSARINFLGSSGILKDVLTYGENGVTESTVRAYKSWAYYKMDLERETKVGWIKFSAIIETMLHTSACHKVYLFVSPSITHIRCSLCNDVVSRHIAGLQDMMIVC